MALRTPTHIAAASTVHDGSTLNGASNVFTPPANAVLFVFAFGALGGGTSANFTLTNSAGLVFTRLAQAVGSALGGSSTVAVWAAVTGDSPVAMTVTRQSNLATVVGGIMAFASTDDSGGIPTLPSGQAAVITTTGTSMTATLPGLPAASSLVFGFAASGPGLTGPTPGTGFTELAEMPIDGVAADAAMQAQYDMANAAATCGWSALPAMASIKLGIAIEVAAAPAPANQFDYTGVGGVQTGGAALLARTRATVAAGGAQTGGAATVEPRFIRVYAGAGGAQAGGAAQTTRLTVRTVAASGGVQASGSAAVSRTIAIVGVGGVQAGGAATVTTSGAQSYTFAGSGGAQAGGSAAVSHTRIVQSAGGVATGGAAHVSRIRSPATAGGVQLGGAAQLAITRAYRAAGGVQAGGAAGLQRLVIIVGAGGAQLGGAASVSFGAQDIEPAEFFFADAGSVLELIDARAGTVLQFFEADADTALEMMVQP